MTTTIASSLRLFRSTFAFASLAALAGCSFHGCGEATLGALGRATFAYHEAGGCFFGCGVDKPLMLGTTETLVVRGDNLPQNLTLISKNPGITLTLDSHTQQCCTKVGNSTTCDSRTPSAAPCGGTLTDTYSASILATQKGKGGYELRTASGELVDSVFNEVEEAASIQVSCAASGGNKSLPVLEIVVPINGSCELVAMPKDSQGREMHASTGFHYMVSDTSVFDVSDFGTETPGSNEVTIKAVGKGKATLTIAGGTVTTQVPVQVP